jgi:hypothetical protein
MVGPTSDEAQVVATNYFNQFALEDSASRNGEALSQLMGYGGFDDAASFQKALWWYYGGIPNYLARPPYVDDETIQRYNAPLVMGVRAAIPLDEVYGDNDEGETGTPLGTVGIPTLFVCGSRDSYLLCENEYALRTSDFVTGQYSYLSEPCGHNLMTVGVVSDGCLTQAALDRVFANITNQILDNTASDEDQSDGGLTVAGIVGVAAGSIVGVVIIAGAFMGRRQAGPKQNAKEEPLHSGNGA